MAGRLTVITGPMFSSKTLDLIGAAEKAKIAGNLVQAFHPDMSSRWKKDAIVSRFGGTEGMISIPSTPLVDLSDFFTKYFNRVYTNVVLFDEVMFFDNSILNVVATLRKMNIDVYAAGLDLDVFGAPFGPMPGLLAMADVVIKKTGICHDCKEDEGRISYTEVSLEDKPKENYRKVGNAQYLCLCWDCYFARIGGR